MRKILVMLLLIFTFLLCMSGIAQAAPKVILDGQTLNFDVSPIYEEGRYLVPFRAISEQLGAKVDWDGKSETVTAVKPGIEVKMKIGGLAVVNGKEINLDVPARIVEGRTVVPIRFLSESFGAKVEWNEKEQKIMISSQILPLVVTEETICAPSDNSVQMNVYAVVENQNDNFISNNVPYIFSAYDSDGKLLSVSRTSNMYIIPPHKKIILGSTLDSSNGKIKTIKLNISSHKWQKLLEPLPVLSVNNVNVKTNYTKNSKGVITKTQTSLLGEVLNESTKAASAWVTVTFFKSGSPLESKNILIRDIPPGESMPFEMVFNGQLDKNELETVVYPGSL